MRVGLIARMDKSGLANQTKNLAELLKPSKILVIDSTPFNGRQQFPSIYTGFNAYRSYGMVKPSEGRIFLRNLDALISCEMFYSDTMINDAKQFGVKTILQYNYEFLVNLLPGNHPLPDVMLSPSYWHLEDAQAQFPNVQYLPPPVDTERFKEALEVNLSKRHKRFLHIVGNVAAHDRNGTEDLINSLKYTSADFELVIKSQTPLQFNNVDPRITFDCSNPADETLLYEGYDALILPRRYAGLCLPMNEALVSGLPVIMPNISPNNRILPKEWLVMARQKGTFMTKTLVEIYESDLSDLAKKINWLCETDIAKQKELAYNIGHTNFSFENLKPKYDGILQ